MVTLTTPNGTFQAEDEKQALALARKAARQAKKDQAVADANRTRADELAKINGFRIYDRQRRNMLANWDCCNAADTLGIPCRNDYSTGMAEYTIDHPDGQSHISLCAAYEVIEMVVRDASGWVSALSIYRHEDSSRTWYAVGCCGAIAELEVLYGISAVDFGR